MQWRHFRIAMPQKLTLRRSASSPSLIASCGAPGSLPCRIDRKETFEEVCCDKGGRRGYASPQRFGGKRARSRLERTTSNIQESKMSFGHMSHPITTAFVARHQRASSPAVDRDDDVPATAYGGTHQQRTLVALVPSLTTMIAVALSLLLCLLFSSDGLAVSSKLTFYNSGSCPYAQRAWIALEETGAEYDSVLVDLQDKSQEFCDLYGKANPLPGARAKVPLLQDGEIVVLCESLVIAEYIAEKCGPQTLLPPTAQERAVVRLFTELCGSSFSYFPLLRAKDDKLEAAVEGFKEGLVNVDTFLTQLGDDKGPFLLGTRFSLAECNVAPFLQRACTILPAFTGTKPVNPIEI